MLARNERCFGASVHPLDDSVPYIIIIATVSRVRRTRLPPFICMHAIIFFPSPPLPYVFLRGFSLPRPAAALLARGRGWEGGSRVFFVRRDSHRGNDDRADSPPPPVRWPTGVISAWWRRSVYIFVYQFTCLPCTRRGVRYTGDAGAPTRTLANNDRIKGRYLYKCI